jgi:hypothetical protein
MEKDAFQWVQSVFALLLQRKVNLNKKENKINLLYFRLWSDFLNQCRPLHANSLQLSDDYPSVEQCEKKYECACNAP